MQSGPLRVATKDALALACAMNRWQCTEYLAQHGEGYARQAKDYFAAFSGMRSRWFNGIFFPRFGPADVSRQIGGLIEEFRRRDQEGIFWLDDGLDREATRQELVAHGCTPGGVLCDMAVDLYKFRTTGRADTQLVEVRTSAQLQSWLDTVGDAFGFSSDLRQNLMDMLVKKNTGFGKPLRNYLLLCDGTVVGAGALYFSAGVAGSYFLAVSTQHRRRGFGRLLGRELQRKVVEEGVRYQVGSCVESLNEFYAGARRIDLGRVELMLVG